eukprot:TRINITY_DN33439_c0_g1_i1.p1 TRINITY_DN33439_c0_g1~~TRINITY_DN33439_c0_g1_i1.p1  ORF type:complete len:240 (+),score=60.96 TRINITY_DN33439_c0_g1_i1:81-800(+)
MSLARIKKARKTLQFYQQHGGYEEPFSVIPDEFFLEKVVQMKVPLDNSLNKLLGDKWTCATTPCIKARIAKLANKKGDKQAIFKQVEKYIENYRVVSCGHANAKPAIECLFSLVAQQQHPTIAADGPEVLGRLRHLAQEGTHVLTVSLNRAVVTLLPPMKSIKSNMETKEEMEQRKVEEERQVIRDMMGEKKHVKRAKAANPLSNKKKVLNVRPVKQDKPAAEKKKRQRNRKPKAASNK